METPWIDSGQLARALERNEAFWRGELDDYPLMWVTVPDAKAGASPPEPAIEEEMWTDVEYIISTANDRLSRTYYAGDSLPVHNSWLGPDQFASWLGADLMLKPRDNTSWIKPFVEDWNDHPEFRIDPGNRWWTLYLEILRASVEAGKGKWVTAYPDLHTGIDALAAIRGPEKLMIDMLETPDLIQRSMKQMTALFKYVIDTVSSIILPGGQGTSNWTMGWSEKRFLCIGQNDFTCLISPEMFEEFCWQDNVACCDYVDVSLLHLDGPGVARHTAKFLELEKLTAIQWIQGAGSPYPSEWIDLLRRIQDGGKPVQLYYGGAHAGDADLFSEIDLLCSNLDGTRLFIWAEVESVEKADAIVRHARDVCRTVQ